MHLLASGLEEEECRDEIEGTPDGIPLLDAVYVAIVDADRGRSSGDSSPGPVMTARPLSMDCNAHLQFIIER